MSIQRVPACRTFICIACKVDRRFARRGWIELDIEGPDDIGRALPWLRRAHATATGGAITNGEGEA